MTEWLWSVARATRSRRLVLPLALAVAATACESDDDPVVVQPGEFEPVITEATAGCPSGNCSAAAASGTPCEAQTRSIRCTRSTIEGGAGR